MLINKILSYPTLTLPIVSLSGLKQAEGHAIQGLKKAFQRYGCCYLSDHGMDTTQLHAVMDQMQQFFSQSTAYKEQVPLVNTNGFIRGYLGMGKESGGSQYELKEGFSYGYPWTSPPSNPLQGQNLWPQEATPTFHPKSFQSVLTQYFDQMVTLSLEVVEGMALAMEQPRTYFSSQCDAGATISIMRLFHYLPYPLDCPDTIGSSAHTDWGFLTLIYQQRQGLQLYHDKQWWNVPHVPELILVNVGDYLSMVSGQFHSPIHRVITTEPEQERYSTVFFYYPNYDLQLTPPSSPKTVFYNTLFDTTMSGQSFGDYIRSKWQGVQR